MHLDRFEIGGRLLEDAVSEHRFGWMDGWRVKIHAMSAAKPHGLLDELRALKAREQTELADSSRRRTEWIEDANALVQTILRWLKPAIDERLVTQDVQNEQRDEQHIGRYQVRVLTLRMPGRRIVTVNPIGTLIPGAWGRVDLESGPRVATLLRTSDRKWVFRSPQGVDTNAMTPLTEESFTDALRELLAE